MGCPSLPPDWAHSRLEYKCPCTATSDNCRLSTEVWSLFFRLLGGKSKQWSYGAWEELLDMLGLLVLGAGWESQSWAVMFILELPESIPRRKCCRGLGSSSLAAGGRAWPSGCLRMVFHLGFAFCEDFLCSEGQG